MPSRKRMLHAGVAAGGAAIAVAAAVALAHAQPGAETREAANTKLVLAMWHGVIEQADDRAVMRYIAPGYSSTTSTSRRGATAS